MRKILYGVIRGALDDLSSVLHITQYKHRRPDLYISGCFKQDPSVGSDLLIFPSPKTLILGINTVSFWQYDWSTTQFAVHAVTNGRRHLGALRRRYAYCQQFITPWIDVTSRDKVRTAVNMRGQSGWSSRICGGDGAMPRVIAKSRSVEHPAPVFLIMSRVFFRRSRKIVESDC
jgi:hypothetical protein